MAQSLVIGIAGGTGSGKTTLMRALVEEFGDSIAVITTKCPLTSGAI